MHDARPRLGDRMLGQVARIGRRRVGHAKAAAQHVDLVDDGIDRVEIAQDRAVLGHDAQAALGQRQRQQDLVVGPAAQPDQAQRVVLRLEVARPGIDRIDLGAALQIVEAAVEVRQRPQAQTRTGAVDVAEPGAGLQHVAYHPHRTAGEALEDAVERAEAQAVRIEEQRSVGRHQAVEVELGREAHAQAARRHAHDLHTSQVGRHVDGEIGRQDEPQRRVAVPVEERPGQRIGHANEDGLRRGDGEDGAARKGHGGPAVAQPACRGESRRVTLANRARHR